VCAIAVIAFKKNIDVRCVCGSALLSDHYGSPATIRHLAGQPLMFSTSTHDTTNCVSVRAQALHLVLTF